LKTTTIALFNRASDVVVSSVSASEGTNRKGVYTAEFADLPAGAYLVGLFEGADPLSWLWVDVLLADGTYEALEVPMSFIKTAAEEILAASRAELTSIPGASATLSEMLRLIYELNRNRVTQTDSAFSLYKADGTTVLGTATFQDDTVTADRGALS
jgi:hypothetical protein